MRDLFTLPPDLPVPEDDGACDHLPGMRMPRIALASTVGGSVRIDAAGSGRAVFFFYPRTGRPEEPAPPEWDRVAGARGCTPQSCGYRDRAARFAAMGVKIFGVSAQSTGYQREFVERTHMPFPFLSDESLVLTKVLRLPTFDFNGLILIKRLALYVEGGVIEKCFYPVFPPDKSAETVLEWLAARDRSGKGTGAA